MTITPELLQDIGPSLYGASCWRTELAKALGVTRKTIMLWPQGTSVIPLAVMGEVVRLCEERKRQIQRVSHRLDCIEDAFLVGRAGMN